ncbi:MAG TPA: outer membrane lipoprotein-sorting protein [Polyangiaceae bacterium]|nr:outer membrane lipoprotein-sorting protein [Polyangiaceae bacterium]
MPVKHLLRLVALALALFAVAAHAEDLTADQIAAKMIRGNGFTWEGARTKLRMTLVEANGAKTERSLEVLGRRKNGKLESKVEFLSPSEVAGTKFLSLEKDGGKTEQHIYLPGLKRTRRIVGREREGSFMGSDFTYADMTKKDASGDKHVKLPDDQIGKDSTYVVETTPANAADAGYGKVQVWVRKTDLVALRTKFFDANGKLVKTLYVKGIRQVDGKPVVVEATMKSENGHQTDLVVDALEQKNDLPDSEFSPASLER